MTTDSPEISEEAATAAAFEAEREGLLSHFGCNDECSKRAYEIEALTNVLAAAYPHLVGPLLERLDQAENDVNEWKDWEARARGRADDLQQRLDQQTAEIERLERSAKSYRRIAEDSVHLSSTKIAELAAAQARAEAALTIIGEDGCYCEPEGSETCTNHRIEAALRGAGDAARPLPEPEQPEETQ